MIWWIVLGVGISNKGATQDLAKILSTYNAGYNNWVLSRTLESFIIPLRFYRFYKFYLVYGYHESSVLHKRY